MENCAPDHIQSVYNAEHADPVAVPGEMKFFYVLTARGHNSDADLSDRFVPCTRTGISRNRYRNVGAGALRDALYHGKRRFLAYDAVLLDKSRIDAD